MNILDQILATKREEVALARSFLSFEEIHAEAQAVTRPVLSFSDSLRNSDTGIIAEFKRRSPSKGFIKEKADVVSIVGGYSENGAAAVSVLTDRDYFGGSLDDLVQARKVSGVPLLRKDFIVDPYQLCQARIAGADVVLLIAAALSPETTQKLARFARSLKLEVLLEIHNEQELECINEYVNVVGVNNRDLSTFTTSVIVSEDLSAVIPEDYLKISESGLSSPETVRKLQDKGFQGFLMGENFMKTPNPASALGDFIKKLSR